MTFLFRHPAPPSGCKFAFSALLGYALAVVGGLALGAGATAALPPSMETGGALPSEGLVLHLDASSVVGKSNGQLLSEGWADQSGLGNDVFPGVAPVFLADSGGGYPAVRFNGADQSLEGSFEMGPSATVFVVFANQTPLLAARDRDPLLAAGGIELAVEHRNPGAPALPSLSASGDLGGSVKTWVNGWDTDQLSANFLPGRFTIFAATYPEGASGERILIGSDGGASGGQNDIREVILYRRALSEDERQSVHRYLGDKHGIETVGRSADGAVDRYNLVLGSQQFGGADAGTYTFGESNVRVLDYARATLRQGAGMIKFRVSNRYFRDDRFSSIAGINSLVKLARDHPEVKSVLDLPVTDILLWMSSFSVPKWQDRIDADGLQPAAQQSIYNEVYEFVVYLLETYSGTGKSFYLGNWEGDWMLTGTGSIAPENLPPARIQAMIDWANIRQKAIDDAKAATPHAEVKVWFYLEMNKADWAREGKACVLNSVIPAMPKIDFISISAYSMHKEGNGRPARTARVHSDLDLIQAQLDAKPNPSIQGSRLIVGEYGYQAGANYQNLTQLARDHAITARDILSWQGGTVRFILQWQFFNEANLASGASKEMRQIDEAMELLPLYYMHENFYREMRRWVEYIHHMTGQLPSERAFADRAVIALNRFDLSEQQPVLKPNNYAAWRDRNFPDPADRGNPALSGPMADPGGSTFFNLFRYAMEMSLFATTSERFPRVSTAGGALRYWVPFDPEKSDLIWIGESSMDLTSWAPQTLPMGTAPGWKEILPPAEAGSRNQAFFRLRLESAP